MPQIPLHTCAKPGCNNLTRDRYCELHNQRPQDTRANSNERGYTYKWHREAKSYLAKHPWCVECGRNGRHSPATEVDHIIPHKGNQQLFWDRGNWQGLCHRCHSRKTAKEDGGFGSRKG